MEHEKIQITFEKVQSSLSKSKKKQKKEKVILPEYFGSDPRQRGGMTHELDDV